MENRRYHVMQVAQELFLQKGFSQTSIQDIIIHANISKGTFYNYFDSKNDCLIAILKYAQKEALERRKQLLLGERADDRVIFAKQIAIRMQVNREQSLLPLFGFVFHSKDKELREFTKKYHLYEIAWLSERFVDIFGEEVYRFAVDGAVAILGLTQQYSLVWSFYMTEELDIEPLILFILRSLDAVAANFKKSEESFIHDDIFAQVESLWEKPRKQDKTIVSLQDLMKTVFAEDELAQQHLQFIITELKSGSRRTYVLQSVVQSFLIHCKKTLQSKETLTIIKDLLKMYG